MGHLGFVLEESACRVDEVLLAWKRRMKFLGLLNLLAAAFQSLVIRKLPNLKIRGHGFAPVRDGAFRVASRGVSKSLLGFCVLERVQEGEAFFERGLHFRGATRREIHFAKLAGGGHAGGTIRSSDRGAS